MGVSAYHFLYISLNSGNNKKCSNLPLIMSVIAITGKMDSGRTCLETKWKALLEGHGGNRFIGCQRAPECKH